MRRGTHALGTALAAVVLASGLRSKPRVLVSQDRNLPCNSRT
jgi:hypothetical protein